MHLVLRHHPPLAAKIFAAFCLLAFCLALSPLAACAASQQENLHKAIKDFEALSTDKTRGMWRESWEKLETRFAAIEKQDTAYAAEAFFYQARSREELGDRSKRKEDWQNATKLYGTFVSRYKTHPLADNALYNRAIIFSGPLKDNGSAIKDLDKIISSYPDGDIFPDAVILRERLEPKSGAAPAQVQPQAQTREKPDAAGKNDVSGQNRLYADAAKEWRALLQDKKRGALRENWLNLEDAFTGAIDAAPGGPEAHKAAFQAARCRDELARRSALRADWQEASRLFGQMAANYPASSLADDSLYAQAEIMHKRLADGDGARNVLNELLKKYPRGDMAPKAKSLLKTLPAQKTAAQGAKAGATAGASGGKTQASSSSSGASSKTPAAGQKISGSSGSNKTKAPASGALLRHISWQGDSESMVVTLELAGKAKYRRATLAADPAKNLPQRARLDLLSTVQGPGLRESITITGAPVSAINNSKQKNSITRVELNLDSARSYKVSVLQNPYRLQIEVHSSKLLPGGEDLSKLKPVSSATVKTGGTLVDQLGLSIKTIMIDAGHGGKDPGAVGNGLRESAITLDLAKKVGAQLQKKGFTVLYTRSSNKFVALGDRTSLANSKKADIFVSIHVNASKNKSLYGLETYYLDDARSDAARLVAARENAVDVGKASDLQFILSDLTRNTKKAESAALSKQVQKACINRLNRSGFKVRDNGVRSAPFYVLMGARMPAFLIEIGYLSNSADAARIKNPKYVQAIADGITDGIIAYQKQLDKMAR